MVPYRAQQFIGDANTVAMTPRHYRLYRTPIVKIDYYEKKTSRASSKRAGH